MAIKLCRILKGVQHTCFLLLNNQHNRDFKQKKQYLVLGRKPPVFWGKDIFELKKIFKKYEMIPF